MSECLISYWQAFFLFLFLFLILFSSLLSQVTTITIKTKSKVQTPKWTIPCYQSIELLKESVVRRGRRGVKYWWNMKWSKVCSADRTLRRRLLETRVHFFSGSWWWNWFPFLFCTSLLFIILLLYPWPYLPHLSHSFFFFLHSNLVCRPVFNDEDDWSFFYFLLFVQLSLGYP